jgi:predicted RNA-binding protein with PIN domain
MRLLIDGYNVMYALGLLGKRLGPDGFRKVRTRFLNDLADTLGAVEAHLTTVVFDAADPPADLPRATTHKGLSVVFAVDDENADERIVRLIAEHSSPRTLTVVSSDLHIRRAATRRKARSLTADAFLAELDARKRRKPAGPATRDRDRDRERAPTPEEAAYWLNEFRALAEGPETRDVFERTPGIPTDAEIAEIEREVERELGSDPRPGRSDSRGSPRRVLDEGGGPVV